MDETESIKDRVILITGGAGSLGKRLVHHLLHFCNPRKVIVYSRDEYKHSTMANEIQDERLRFLVGDVRDVERLRWAFKEVDIVMHAAAMKQVPACEYNPEEAIKTNVGGAQAIIDASRDSHLEKVVFTSTDKAVMPLNLYGATKAAAEKLFIAANAMNPIFSCTRWGNIENSRGSVIPYFKDLIRQGVRELPLTDKRMTRFHVSIVDAVSMVLRAIAGKPGLTWILKSPSIRMVDLVEALGCQYKETGIRPGEKLHETLVCESEAKRTLTYDGYMTILPQTVFDTSIQYEQDGAGHLETAYESDRNVFLTVEEIKERIC